MESRPSSDQNVNYNLMFAMYYIFKLAAPVVSCVAIYLGYRLFILGVTGQASLSVESKTVGAQLINAAPGLFFAIGGLTTLGISTFKGVAFTFSPHEGSIKGALD
jgi:hypothetical protein